MDFLKALFAEGEALSFDQLKAKVEAAKLNVVDLSKGGYISQDKYNDKVKQLSDQVQTLTDQATKRDADLAGLQSKLTAAQADGTKLGEVQTALSDLQRRYDDEKKDWEGKLAQQAYEFAVRERAGTLKFSSSAAKKAFIQEAIGKGFKLDGDTLLGYEDFVTKYKADDPGAFAAEDTNTDPAGGDVPPAAPPKVVLPPNNNGGGKQSSAPSFNFPFGGVRPKPQE